MRNYPLKIIYGLAAGLRSSQHDKHSGRMLSCANLESFEHGLRGYRPVSMPFSQDAFDAAGIIPRFPFPQFHRGKTIQLLLDSNKIFLVDDNYNISSLNTYDVANPANTKAIPSGHSWHIVDMFETLWLFNGSCVVMLPYVQRMIGGYEKVLVSDTVKVNCGCYYKGRMLMGGFNKDYQFSSSWKNLYQTLADKRSLSFDYAVGLDKSSVMWSIIGGGDLMFMFDFARAMTGHITTAEGLTENLWSQSKPFVIEAIKRNDGGSTKLDIGEVLATKVIGESALIYGSRGIKALTHSYEQVTNTPAFRETHISDVGIAYGGAINGDHKRHCFVGTDGKLRMVDAEFQIATLGYKEFFEPYVNVEIIVSYDSVHNRFLICTGDRTYILNFVSIEGNVVPALTWTTQQVNSVAPGKDVVGVATSIGVCTQHDVINNIGSFKVGAFDFGSRGHKTITGVELHGEIDTDAHLVYHYALEDNLDMVELDPELVNPDGEVRFNVEGTDIDVEITFDDFRKVVLNTITIHRYYTDLRYSRGPNADTAVA